MHSVESCFVFILSLTNHRFLCGWSAWGAYNIGIFFWRPTTIAKELAKEWLQLLLSDDKIWDQNGFNDLARNVTGPSVGHDSLFWAYRGNLKMGILPVSLFCSGHTYFIQVFLLL